jgi:hypothetical protein
VRLTVGCDLCFLCMVQIVLCRVIREKQFLRSDWLNEMEEMCPRECIDRLKTYNSGKLSRGVQISVRPGYIFSCGVHNICTLWAISMDLDTT